MTSYQYLMSMVDFFPRGMPPGMLGMLAKDTFMSVLAVSYEYKLISRRRKARQYIPTFKEKLKMQAPRGRLGIDGESYVGSFNTCGHTIH